MKLQIIAMTPSYLHISAPTYLLIYSPVISAFVQPGRVWLERVVEVEVRIVQKQVKSPAFLFTVSSTLSLRNIEGKCISVLKNAAEV